MGDAARGYFLGRLTRDPGHRAPGKDPVNFGIAINTRRQDKERVDFFECEAWDKLGATIREHARKGQQLFLEVVPYLSQWTAKDGAQRKDVRFTVVRCEFVGNKPTAQAGGAPAAEPVDDLNDNLREFLG